MICPHISECNRSGCKGFCTDGPSSDDGVDADPCLALRVFAAASKRHDEDMRRSLRHARQWTLFWFVCWAISVAYRVMETRVQ